MNAIYISDSWVLDATFLKNNSKYINHNIVCYQFETFNLQFLITNNLGLRFNSFGMVFAQIKLLLLIYLVQEEMFAFAIVTNFLFVEMTYGNTM